MSGNAIKLCKLLRLELKSLSRLLVRREEWVVAEVLRHSAPGTTNKKAGAQVSQAPTFLQQSPSVNRRTARRAELSALTGCFPALGAQRRGRLLAHVGNL